MRRESTHQNRELKQQKKTDPKLLLLYASLCVIGLAQVREIERVLLRQTSKLDQKKKTAGISPQRF